MRPISLILLLVLFGSCQHQPQKENPYNLELVSSVAEYNRLVSNDPEKALVDIGNHIPGIAIDIRYATKNNFMHQKVYPSPRALIRKPLADSLLKIQNDLSANTEQGAIEECNGEIWLYSV